MASPILVVAALFLLAGVLAQRAFGKQHRVPKGAKVPPGPPGKMLDPREISSFSVPTPSLVAHHALIPVLSRPISLPKAQ